MKDTQRECERLLNNISTINMDVDRETEMNLTQMEIRALLLHEFILGDKATNNMCKILGQDIISTRTAQRWFNRFNIGNYGLDDLSFSERLVEVNLDRLKQLAEDDPQLTTRCLAEQLGCSHTAVETYLNDLGKMWKYGVSIPYELSACQLQHRLDVCMNLLTPHRNYEWLRNLVTDDEKWVPYINHASKRQWLSVDQVGT